MIARNRERNSSERMEREKRKGLTKGGYGRRQGIRIEWRRERESPGECWARRESVGESVSVGSRDGVIYLLKKY